MRLLALASGMGVTRQTWNTVAQPSSAGLSYISGTNIFSTNKDVFMLKAAHNMNLIVKTIFILFLLQTIFCEQKRERFMIFSTGENKISNCDRICLSEAALLTEKNPHFRQIVGRFGIGIFRNVECELTRNKPDQKIPGGTIAQLHNVY